jgi:hypothetical protein
VRRLVDGDDDVPHRLPSRVPANMLNQALSFLHQKVTLDPELQVSKNEIPHGYMEHGFYIIHNSPVQILENFG